MNEYIYTAKEETGEVVRASVRASSRYEALSMLSEKRKTVIELEEERTGSSSTTTARASSRRFLGGFGSHVSLGDRAIFCRQLAISVNSGVPLRESLESITLDMDNPRFKAVLVRVLKSLDDGKMFSQSLVGFESVFSRLFVALVRSAEESGTMAHTLNYLAASMEKADRLARKIKSITAYPMFIGIFFCIACVIMTVFVLPQFQAVFTSFHSKLPVISQVVFVINSFILRNSPIIGVSIVCLAIGITTYCKSRLGRPHFDRFVLKVPLVGTCIRKLAVARFCRNFAMLMKGGVPVATAIEITSATLNNKVLESSLMSSRSRIMSGEAIAPSLDKKVFPRLLVRMIGVGESSGRLPEVLEQVSDVYEDQVESSILMATAMFEPVVICIFGGMILTLVLAIYMPVFTVASQMK